MERHRGHALAGIADAAVTNLDCDVQGRLGHTERAKNKISDWCRRQEAIIDTPDDDDVAAKWRAFHSAHIAWKITWVGVETRIQLGEKVDLELFKVQGLEVMRLAEEWKKARKQHDGTS